MKKFDDVYVPECGDILLRKANNMQSYIDFFGENGDNKGYIAFKNYVYSKPEELRDYLLNAFPNQLVNKLKRN